MFVVILEFLWLFSNMTTVEQSNYNAAGGLLVVPPMFKTFTSLILVKGPLNQEVFQNVFSFRTYVHFHNYNRCSL